MKSAELIITHITLEMLVRRPYLLNSAVMDFKHLPTTIERWNEADQYPSQLLPWASVISRQPKN